MNCIANSVQEEADKLYSTRPWQFILSYRKHFLQCSHLYGIDFNAAISQL